MSSTHTAAAGTGDPRRALGDRGERLALAHLGRLGYTLIARNHRTRWGEIDLIVFDGTTLAFVEVKTRRSSGRAGSALDAVAHGKQQQVRRMAAAWLAEVEDRPRSPEIRFDVVGVSFDRAGMNLAVEHIRSAF